MGWFTVHGWDTYIGNRPEGWEPGKFTITRKDVGRIDPKLLLDLPGTNKEHFYLRNNGDDTFQAVRYPGEKWLEFVDWAKHELANGKAAVMVTKDRHGHVSIHEGNHRVRAAVEAGLKEIPVEFVYWAFSEDSGLIYDPGTGRFSPRGYAPATKLSKLTFRLAQAPSTAYCASSTLFHRTAGNESVESLVDEFMRFLDPDGRLPRPTIKIQSNASSTWLGQFLSEGSFEGNTCTTVQATLYFQKVLLDAPADLRRVVAHEVAHYIAFAADVLGKHLQDYNDIVTAQNKVGGHTKTWWAVVQKVNATYGQDFITQTSDQSYTFEAKEVNLFVMRQADRLDWCWSTQIPTRVVETMAALNGVGQGISCFVGKTKSRALVIPDAKASNASYRWATTWTEEQIEAIQAAWESQPNQFADYASGVKGTTKPPAITWTLVMANPYRPDSPYASEVPRWINAWKVRRPLTEAEKDVIGQLNALGMDTRFKRVRGDDALFNTLPQLERESVVHQRGRQVSDVMLPECQERLLGHWPGAERPVKQKTAHIERNLYLDMDGVLLDYELGAHEAGVAPEDFKDQPGAYRHLKPMPGALQAVEELQRRWGVKHVHILSTPPSSRFEEAKREKLENLAEVFPNIPHSQVILTDDKGKHGTPYDTLVDDHPTWNGADQFPGTVIKFERGNAWVNVLGDDQLKTASAWDAETSRWHAREDDLAVRQVQQGLRQHFNQLINSLHVQPQGRTMTLRQFLTHNPITEMFRSTDKSVRMMSYRLRQDLETFLSQNYRDDQIQRFKAQFGANVTDWLSKKIIARQAALFTRLAVSDDLLLKRYGITPDQLALAKAVDTGAYTEWVVKQMVGVKPKRPDLSYEEANSKRPTIRLPEDTDKLKTLLAFFTKLKRSPKFTGNKDINAYLPADIAKLRVQMEQAQDSGEESQLSNREQRAQRREGALLWSGQTEEHHVEVFQPTEVQALMEIGGGPGLTMDFTPTQHTEWCTTQEGYATKYLKEGDIYLFKVDGKNFAQFHPNSNQFQDVLDGDIPYVGADEYKIVDQPELVAGLVGAGLNGVGGFHALDVKTANPRALAHYFGREGDDLDDEVAERIDADPVAVAILLAEYDFEPQEGDEERILASPEASGTYAKALVRRYFQAMMAGRVSPFFQQAVVSALHDKTSADTLIYWLLNRLKNSAFRKEADLPAWFAPIQQLIRSNGDYMRQALPVFPELEDVFAAQYPEQALAFAQNTRGGKPWDALEKAIVASGNQELALRYSVYQDTSPYTSNALKALIWGKEPETDEAAWLMCNHVIQLVQWLSRNLYANHPIPYEESKKFIPEVGEHAVWESRSASQLAIYAAKCYQDQPDKLRAALKFIAEIGQVAAASNYIEYTKSAVKAEPLEPLILQMMLNSSIYGVEAAQYVANIYDPNVKGTHDAAVVLAKQLQARGVELSDTVKRRLKL